MVLCYLTGQAAESGTHIGGQTLLGVVMDKSFVKIVCQVRLAVKLCSSCQSQ